MKKEDFINAVLNSTNEMTQVTPEEDLYLKIERRINNKEVVSINTLWMVAASIAVLIMLNVTLLNKYNSAKTSELSSLEHSINKSNQLYK